MDISLFKSGKTDGLRTRETPRTYRPPAQSRASLLYAVLATGSLDGRGSSPPPLGVPR